MADSRGRVWASIPGLANRARVPVEDAKSAIERFLSPDEYSRTPDNDGKRVEPIDGGWRLLNHEKYRAIRDEEAIKESKRKYINTKRALEKAASSECLHMSTYENVDRSRHNAEAEAEADKRKKERARASRLPSSWELPEDLRRWAKEARPELNPDAVASDFRDYWIAVPGTKGTKLDWSATWRKWVRNTNAPKGSSVVAVTVPSMEADKTLAFLDAQTMTDDERLAADEARRRALKAVRGIA